MTQPPHDGGPGPSGENPEGSASSDPGSPDYAGSPDDGPRRGAHRAGARPTPPPPPPAGAPYWPTPPDAPPGEKLKQPLADTLPVRLLQAGAAILAVALVAGVIYLLFGDNNGEKNQSSGTTPHTSAPVTPGPTTTGTTSGPATTTGKPTSPTGQPAGGKTTTKPAGKPTTSKPAGKPTTKPATKPTAPPTTKPTAKPPTAKPPTAKPTTAAPPPVAVKAPLLVLNNSRIHGLAVTGAATFRGGGWTVVGTGNYSGRLPETTVFYAPGSQAAAETLARQFPTVTAVKPRPAGLRADAPLVVVLTRYFKP